LAHYRGSMGWLAYIFAFVAGALISLQTGSNSQLKKSLGQPLSALIINYMAGITLTILATAARRVPLPSVQQIADVPWWGWIGGFFGAFYGFAAILLASRLGAATVTALVITGQLICAVVLDHFGWMGFAGHPASLARIAGCVLMIAGLTLISLF
jgi:bacterial/archaeal transporter family-2 protein